VTRRAAWFKRVKRAAGPAGAGDAVGARQGQWNAHTREPCGRHESADGPALGPGGVRGDLRPASRHMWLRRIDLAVPESPRQHSGRVRSDHAAQSERGLRDHARQHRRRRGSISCSSSCANRREGRRPAGRRGRARDASVRGRSRALRRARWESSGAPLGQLGARLVRLGCALLSIRPTPMAREEIVLEPTVIGRYGCGTVTGVR
jgi:hypothetical protein